MREDWTLLQLKKCHLQNSKLKNIFVCDNKKQYQMFLQKKNGESSSNQKLFESILDILTEINNIEY